MSNENKKTLANAKKALLDKLVKRDMEEGYAACTGVLNSVPHPEIQAQLFESTFMEPIKTLINEGKDIYLNVEAERSLPSMWTIVAGSLNTPVNVVSGEGPDREILGTLPPFCSPMYITKEANDSKANTKLLEAVYRENGPNPNEYLMKLDQGMKMVSDEVKQRAKMDEHKKNWLDSIKQIETKLKERKPKTGKETKEKTKSTSNNTGTEFQW